MNWENRDSNRLFVQGSPKLRGHDSRHSQCTPDYVIASQALSDLRDCPQQQGHASYPDCSSYFSALANPVAVVVLELRTSSPIVKQMAGNGRVVGGVTEGLVVYYTFHHRSGSLVYGVVQAVVTCLRVVSQVDA